MDVAALATLSRLLDEALDLPPQERSSWIDRLSSEYEPLKPRLRRLLDDALVLGTSSVLTLPKFPGLRETGGPSSPTPRDAGVEIGAYRLLRSLGEGGMGEVWLAERADGLVKRPVALKLPHQSWARAGLTERIARERDILAALTHPHIARLYDAGVAADGQPYLALEYIDGQPLDRYCASRSLSVRERLALFLQVVGAVSHAHSQLVIHRDLKPSNILVTEDGRVHLLDFGIAKLLEDDEGSDSLLTQVSGRVLTPQYASPEQVRGLRIGTASDVYSLGVILYELLTGVRPYVVEPRRSAAAIEDAILSADVERPSRRVSDAPTRRALSGDLDWIVLKALAREPASRYPSAAAFGEDLERHLRNEPVLASPPSTGYRLRKFVRRHRVAVGAVTAVAAALIVAVAGTTVGLVRAQRAEAASRVAAERARTEAQTADRVSQFLVDMFDLAKPEEADGRPVTARDMLDRGISKIDSSLTQEPLVESRLRRSVGDAYSQLGEYPVARTQLERSVAAARAAGQQGETELVRALTLLGQLQRRVDDTTGAEQSLREALALAERQQSPDPDHVGLVMNELALLLRTRNQDEALNLYRRVHALIVASKGPDHQDAGLLLTNIGALLTRMRRYQEARTTFEQALPILSAHLKDDDPRVGVLIGNLALAERQLGNLDRAIELQQRDLAIVTRVYGADHPNVAPTLINLARTNEDAGRYSEAIEQIQKALAILRQHFKPQHGLVITAENTRSLLLLKLGRVEESRALLESLVRLSPDSAEAEGALASSRIQLAHHERLSGNWSRALAMSAAVMGDPTMARDLSLVSDAAWAHACTIAARGDKEESEAWRQRALEIHERDRQSTPASRLHLHARHYACGGDAARAIALLKEAVAAGYSNPAIHVDPSFAVVRAHPEFATVVRTIRSPLLSR
jgi:serine/threonine-protein kinase